VAAREGGELPQNLLHPQWFVVLRCSVVAAGILPAGRVGGTVWEWEPLRLAIPFERDAPSRASGSRSGPSPPPRRLEACCHNQESHPREAVESAYGKTPTAPPARSRSCCRCRAASAGCTPATSSCASSGARP